MNVRVGWGRTRGWTSAHAFELGCLLFGIVLRVAQLHTHRPEWGYDFFEHSTAVDWWANHFRMPPLELSRGASHPQLYYALAALIRRAGGSWSAVQALSVSFGCIRLCLVFLAALRYLPTNRAARIFIISLAAVMPASVQLDGMVTQEALNNLVSVGFGIAVLELCRAPTERRRLPAVAVGLTAGLGLLVKNSNFALLGVLLVAPWLELIQGRGIGLRGALGRARSWVMATAVAVSLCGWQFAYNRVAYGRAVLDGWYKRPTEDTERVAAHLTPVLDRRSVAYFIGFSPDVLNFPFPPSGVEPNSRLWSILIASTFCDYYGYRFAPPWGEGQLLLAGSQHAEVSERSVELARASVASGVFIAMMTAASSAIVAVRLVRRREVARLLMLLIPGFALLGQMYFATKYPYDFEGVVKGVYFHFATLPCYVIFGMTLAWLCRRRGLHWVAIPATLTLLPVAAYTTYCVFR